MENYKGKKEEIDFIAHILIPVLRMMNNEDMDAYIEVLKKEATDENGKTDEIKRKNIDSFYRGLFDSFSDFLGTENLESIVNLKVEHSSVMTKNQEDVFYNDFISNISSLQDDVYDIDIFDIQETKIQTEKMSFIATIDFNKFSTEQLEKILDVMPIGKVVIKNINVEQDKDKYEKMTKILEDRKIEQINSVNTESKNCFNLNLSDENIEDTLSDISRSNNESLTMLIDISDMFEDDVIYNNFNNLAILFNTEVIDPVLGDEKYIDERQLSNIDSKELYNLLCCA